MVSSDVLENLEALALVRQYCEVVFNNEGGKVTLHGVIEKIYLRENSYVLQMQSGQEIFVNNLIKVDGITYEGFC